jgi:hypothetical protein
MRKTLWVPLAALSIAGFVVAGMALADGMHEEKVSIKLSAAPKVKTSAGGTATFVLNKEGTSIHYTLKLSGIQNVTMGHVHEVGDDGTPAAVVAWLYPTTGNAPSLREGAFKGTLAEGDITAEKLGGPLKGKSAKDLFDKIEYGTAGVAIHTKQNPGGELWSIHKEKEKGKKKM